MTEDMGVHLEKSLTTVLIFVIFFRKVNFLPSLGPDPALFMH